MPSGAAVALVALLVRLAAIWLIPNEQISDSVWYDGAARSLLGGAGYGYHGERAWFPPGYPFVLAAAYGIFGATDVVGKVLNAGLEALACALTCEAGGRLLGARAGVAAGLILAAWPNFTLHTLILSTEPLSAALWIAAVLIALGLATGRADPPRLALLGATTALAVLTRPVSLVLVPAVAITVLAAGGTRRRAVVAAAVATAVTCVLVAGWSVRNAQVFGRPVLISTNGGYNLWQVNNDYADGTDFFWSRVPPGIPEFETMRDGDELTRSDQGYALALRFMREHPDRVVALTPRKAFELWRTDTSAVYEAVTSPPMARSTAVADALRRNDPLLRAAAFAFYLGVLAAAAGGIALLVRGRPSTLAVLLAPPALLTAFYLFFQSKDRFHVPVDPFLALLAAPAVLWLSDRWRRGKSAARA